LAHFAGGIAVLVAALGLATIPPAAATSINITRISGGSRDETAIAVSVERFPNGGAKSVVLASDANFPDALAGAPLAVAKDGPLLLVPPSGLTQEVSQEITRVAPAGSTVYILGGSVAIPTSVDSALSSMGYAPVRLAGADRFGTAVAIAGALGNPDTVFEATGDDFPDGLSAGAAAAASQGVVLLTNGSSQAAETAAYLSAHPGNHYAIGGPAAAADPTATAVIGADRYATAVAVAQKFFVDPKVAGFASAVTFPDALSGGADIGAQGGPLLLVPPSGALPASVSGYLSATPSITGGFLFGGTAAVGSDVQSEVASGGMGGGSGASGQPSGPGYSAALAYWQAGPSQPDASSEGQEWLNAANTLQQAETDGSDTNTSGYATAVTELDQMVNTPSASEQTAQQTTDFENDITALDTFFNTPGLYSGLT
jgi:hypothetical protein